MVWGVTQSIHDAPPARPWPGATGADLGALDAMAGLAAGSGCVVHVVVARAPGVVEHARAAARAAGVQATADLLPRTIRVRFSP
jgi:hypothetical protein